MMRAERNMAIECLLNESLPTGLPVPGLWFGSSLPDVWISYNSLDRNPVSVPSRGLNDAMRLSFITNVTIGVRTPLPLTADLS